MTKYNWDERHIITFPEKKLALETKDLHVYYGQKEAINGIDMQFEKNKITALIGPSGCGKSTFLRSLNRMNDTIDVAKVTGQILYEGVDVKGSGTVGIITYLRTDSTLSLIHISEPTSH